MRRATLLRAQGYAFQCENGWFGDELWFHKTFAPAREGPPFLRAEEVPVGWPRHMRKKMREKCLWHQYRVHGWPAAGPSGTDDTGRQVAMGRTSNRHADFNQTFRPSPAAGVAVAPPRQRPHGTAGPSVQARNQTFVRCIEQLRPQCALTRAALLAFATPDAHNGNARRANGRE